jgi:hypothetical protein
MADPSPTANPQVPQGLAELYALNGKTLLDNLIIRLSEHDQTYDDGLIQARTQFNKLVTDAQSASSLALMNAVTIANAVANQQLRHAEIAAADQWEEQESEADIQSQVPALSNDDLAKISQAVTAAITAVLANMATGRPPANQSGTTATPVAGS